MTFCVTPRTFPGRAPCWRWLWQTLTDEFRALCTYPRDNGVAQHLLEDRDQLVAHTRDRSKLFEVHMRTTGCRCAVEEHRNGRH